MYGKHHMEESKEQISKSMIGKAAGSNNGNWIDGRSYEPYTSEFNNKLREKIRKRDNYLCQKCRKPEMSEGQRLAVHHIDYNKKNNSQQNLITLCVKCNSKVNTNRKKWKIFFKKKIKSSEKDFQLCFCN